MGTGRGIVATRDASSLGYSAPIALHDFTRLEQGNSRPDRADLAVEVPVALVYNGRPHVVMMCTPADLDDFAFGFTISENIATAEQIRRVDVVKYSKGIELQIEIPSEQAELVSHRGRAIEGRTGCGLCGVEVIGDAIRQPRLVQSALVVSRDALWRAIETLDSEQPLNRATHAIHAAAWSAKDGALGTVREDVGRHNALDKVLGALARARADASAGFFVVTSRASYELVQKTAAANVPLLAAVSRPTALAVALAETTGITLVGLLRGQSANVYSHVERLHDARP